MLVDPPSYVWRNSSHLTQSSLHMTYRVWLLFPWRHDNWREQAGPAQKAYSHVANAIQQHGNEQVSELDSPLIDLRIGD